MESLRKILKWRRVMKQITRYIVIGIISAMLLITGWCGRQYCLQRQLAEKVLRFHVLANSDSAEDQQLKLKVRDAIGSYMQEYMQKNEDDKFLLSVLLNEYDERYINEYISRHHLENVKMK